MEHAFVGRGAAPDQSVDAGKECVDMPFAGAQQQRGQRRRERERVECGNRDRKRDGQGKLLVEPPGRTRKQRDRHKDCDQHQRRGDDRASDFLHADAGGLMRFLDALFQVALHVLDDHDGVVDHQARGQGNAEQSQGVDGESEELGEDEGPEQRNRDGDSGNDGAAPALQEQVNLYDHNGDSFGQRLQHFLDGFAHGPRGIEGDGVLQPGREVMGEAFHLGTRGAVHIQGVGVGQLQYAEPHGVHAVVPQLAAVAFRSQLGTTHVAELDQGTIAPPLDHDAVEFARVVQASGGADADLVGKIGGRRRLSHLARGHLHVLLAQGIHHVRRGQVARRQFDWVEPQAHGIFAFAKDDDVAHALQPFEGIANVNVKIVADEQIVVAVVIGIEAESYYERAGVLVDAYARGLYFDRQPAQDGSGAVLHVDGGNIQAAVQVKHYADSAAAVVVAVRGHIAHALGPVDGLLQQCSYAGFHYLRIRSGIEGADGNRGRRQVGVLRDRQRRDGHHPGKHNQQRTYRSKNRAANEEVDHKAAVSI